MVLVRIKQFIGHFGLEIRKIQFKLKGKKGSVKESNQQKNSVVWPLAGLILKIPTQMTQRLTHWCGC